MTDTAMLMLAFVDPVHASQQVFRRALTALSEPGVVETVDDAPGMDRLAPATYALCLSLFDSDTPVWLSPLLDTPALRANLAFHCGCPIVAAPQDAVFALMAGTESAEVPAFNAGTDRDPDLSCTVLMQLSQLDGGPATTWQGPGIPGSRVMRLPVSDAFWDQRARHGFPQGLDFFFTAGDALVGLPRSIRVLRMMQEVN